MSSFTLPEQTATVSQAPPPSAAVMGLNFLIALSQRRRLLQIVLPISLIAGLAVATVLKPRYTATTILLPPQQASSSASSLISQLGSLGAMSGMGGSSLKNPVDLYGGFIQTQTVEDAMVREFNLLDQYKVKRLSQARKMLEGRTAVDTKGKDGLLRLSVTDDSPERAAQLANGYIALTIKLTQSLAISEAAQRRLFMEQQMQQSKNRLSEAEDDLKKTENTTGIIQIEAQGKALIESIANLRAQIASKEVQLQSLKTFAADENAEVQKVRQQLSTMRGQLAQLDSEDKTHANGSKAQMSNQGLEYARKLREVKYQEAIVQIVARQFEAAKMDEAREGAMLQVVDPARPPDYKSGPSRLLVVIGFLAVGLFGSLAFILLELVWRSILRDPYIKDNVALLKRSRRGRA